MSALLGIVGLLVFLYVRPHEFSRALRDYNAIYPCFVLSLLGMAHDVVGGRAKVFSTPMLRYVLAFGLWCPVTLAVRSPSKLGGGVASAVVCAALYVVLAHGVQRVATLRKVGAVVLALGLFVGGVGFVQGLSPFQCVIVNPGQSSATAVPDGRPCTGEGPNVSAYDGVNECLLGGTGRFAYACERVGPLDTTSVGGGRVRYLGVLLDPNDLALATAMAVPFAFALSAMRRSILRVALLLGTLAVIGGEIVMTHSRGGQLTLGAVLATYFVKRYGVRRGAVAGAIMVIPLAILGGRSDEAALDSTMERLGCSAAGVKMFLTYPFTGVGYTRYVEYHGQTAHNAYVLTAGELGAPGLWLFAVILYLSIKIPVAVLRRDLGASDDARALHALSLALLSALAGAAVGVFFLSWTYHYVLWIYFGLSGALYSVVKRFDPSFECRLERREAVRVALGCLALLALWSAYIVRKGAWQ